MKRIYKWYSGLSKRFRDSVLISISLVGFISTILSIIGISLGDWEKSSIWLRILIVAVIFVGIGALSYYMIGTIFKESINLSIHNTPVSICYGDIFNTSGWKVIGCDTHFDTRVDDIVISKNSLHGQLFLNHGKLDEIERAINAEAARQRLTKSKAGTYSFPLGTIIRYDSSVDNQTYLMLSMIELDTQYESHTNMVNYEHMLMHMWKEIDRVYASNDIVLPILCDGITRFDDGVKNKDDLLRCMLCTFNSSSVSLNSQVKIVIFDNNDDNNEISLYEYKEIFNGLPRR